MSGYVYILLSEKDHKIYVGSTDNLERRKQEHDRGQVAATRNRRPFKIIYTESYQNIVDARAKEKYYKTTSGRRKLRKILDKYIAG